jgi:hypothetical protein
MSRGKGDHCNPVMAVDGLGTLYVVWQENTRGVWDVCLSICVDGQTWSAPMRLTDSEEDHVNPAIAAGPLPSGLVAIAWQAGATGRQDVYVAQSWDAFVSAEVAQVTSDDADQADPAVAIDGADTILVVWADSRGGSSDLYAATSAEGPWTNVPVVAIDSNQTQPAVAVDSTGRVHLIWVDDLGGDADIFYAVSEELPTGPVTCIDIIDDESRAEQQSPAIVVARDASGVERVLAGWVDGRNGDADLYAADLTTGSPPTNVLVGHGGAAGNQREISFGVGVAGDPYVVCTDDGSGGPQVYCSGPLDV